MSTNSLAPIALFVYNRPKHTSITLESLIKNKLSSESTLYIFSEGPKINAKKNEIQKIRETRSLIRSRKWCKNNFIFESKTNMGLANSIISGINKVLENHDKIIVLEDDLYLSKFFLEFMNLSLNRYSNNKNIMQISGYVYPIKNQNNSFFQNYISSWGWGTWKRSWNLYIDDINILLDKIESKKNIFNKVQDYYSMLLKQKNGYIDSWAIKWNASVCINNGIVLYPNKSFVRNIGFDKYGIHCKNEWYAKHFIKQELSTILEVNYPNIIDIDKNATEKIKTFLKKIDRPPLMIKFKEKIKIILRIK